MASMSNDIELSKHDYLLYELIQNLDKYAFQEGSEGKAYFIDGKYIVKEYIRSMSLEPEVFDNVFEAYCEEMKKFAEQGYSVPKTYSWLKVPNIEQNHNNYVFEAMPYRYYILQELVPGRWMYYDIDEFAEIYNLCKDICSHEDMMRIMADSSCGSTKIKTEIIKTYVSDYLTMNEMIESMPNGEFEHFIFSVYQMKQNGKFSHPDLFRKNVLVDQSKMYLIDNRIDQLSNYWFLEMDSVEDILNEMILLFELNRSLQENTIMDRKTIMKNSSISNMLKKNRSLCVAIMQKIVKVFKEQIQMDPIRYPSQYRVIEKNVRKIIEEDADKVLNTIPTVFEK